MFDAEAVLTLLAPFRTGRATDDDHARLRDALASVAANRAEVERSSRLAADSAGVLAAMVGRTALVADAAEPFLLLENGLHDSSDALARLADQLRQVEAGLRTVDLVYARSRAARPR